MTSPAAHTGGCQCGAIRFTVAHLGRATICYCRMCQKATGGIGGVFVLAENLTITRGTLKHFESSNQAKRGFCGDCGTPLTFENDVGIDVTIATFDRAVEIAPVLQISRQTRLPWVDALPTLPHRTVAETAEVASHTTGIVSHQHPDHDTSDWPPAR